MYKQISDKVHGFIRISNLACRIVDSPQFQRLRYLHQLGTCHYVFPNATHKRFEHSLGTYHLAGRILESIIKNSNIKEINRCMAEVAELKEYYAGREISNYLDPFVCELIKIAALCHDIGHGPFSHVFDDIFLPSIRGEREFNIAELHEHRSIEILKHIIKKDSELSKIITDNCVKFIGNLINPKDEHTGFVYQIVSNSLNNIDVDKYDYMTRDTLTLALQFKFEFNILIDNATVINNIICFPEKICYEVAALFGTRYRLHKQIYCHKTVVSIQYMVRDIMILLDPIMKLYDAIFNMDKFCELTDDYVLNYVKFAYDNIDNYTEEQRQLIKKAKYLLDNINSRHLYRLGKTVVSDKKIVPDKADIVHYAKIGFVSGKKSNPFDNLYFFKHKNPNVCYKIEKEKISALIPNNYQEHIYMYYTTTL
jgi:deoxynucleoside triphosphate triphosphohydrolase SAMHD1